MNVNPLSTQPAAPSFESRGQNSEQRSYQRELRLAVNSLNRAEYYGPRSQLAISIDQQTNRPLLQLIDTPTTEVLLQVPPEYVLEIARALHNRTL